MYNTFEGTLLKTYLVRHVYRKPQFENSECIIMQLVVSFHVIFTVMWARQVACMEKAWMG